ncbi:peptide-methionine (S)-S-oxide reductase MsrA [uncultured Bartonella sp.]|uniref:peptide-methionine (S)-S-oxide reductase MsrA n=1 Tax=uncultured Bartonella sp. TaxID=104108 RepID=UPI002627226D|nr:peptide-methionine (S)-S-oxide reductase MsrA [uncultured Bartonella sp.]
MYDFSYLSEKLRLPKKEEALTGRAEPIATAEKHFVNGHNLKEPYPENMHHIIVAMGCFWGVERLFWKIPGVFVTVAGYTGGFTPNPTYEEVCSGKTGHTEAVLIVYDPKHLGLDNILKIFWEQHDPTQGMRQGNDIGNNYRSGLYLANEHDLAIAQQSKALFEKSLKQKGMGPITSEIALEGPFYFAEDYHQQYLAKNPHGYCGLKGTGVTCVIGQI